MAELFVEYRNGKPYAYRYGEPWVAMQLAMEGGFKTSAEAIAAWEREQRDRERSYVLQVMEENNAEEELRECECEVSVPVEAAAGTRGTI